MAKRHVCALLSVVLSCCFLCACVASPVTLPVSSAGVDERVLSDARVQYRNASLIVTGSCIQQHINAQGLSCYDLLISDILAGDAASGDVIHCTAGPMEEGKQYLLYLGQDAQDVNHAEDMAGYTLLSTTPIPIVDSDVIWNGSRFPLATLKEDIVKLSTIISAPGPLYYYDSLRTLAEASSEIFIGRVLEKPAQQQLVFSIRNGGATEKNSYSASIVTVEAYGAIKGALSYGQQIELVHCPGRIGEMVSAATLQPMACNITQSAGLQQGGYYVFFLTNSTDNKQPYYFPVNPLQGYVPVSGEAISPLAANRPVSPYRELTPLVQAIQAVLSNRPAAS